MHRKWLAIALLASPVFAVDRYDRVERQDMRQAIAFERHKEEAARRQARMERSRKSREDRADRQAPDHEKPRQPRVNRK